MICYYIIYIKYKLFSMLFAGDQLEGERGHIYIDVIGRTRQQWLRQHWVFLLVRHVRLTPPDDGTGDLKLLVQ